MASKNRVALEKGHRGSFEAAKRRILASQSVCGICGKPVDKSLRYPHPMSACIDHIIPITKGGHPSDTDNLQLAHWSCNRQKSDKIFFKKENNNDSLVVNNRDLPQSIDWQNFRFDGA